MAHSNQARKRIRQNEKRRLRNRTVLGTYRNAVSAAKAGSRAALRTPQSS